MRNSYPRCVSIAYPWKIQVLCQLVAGMLILALLFLTGCSKRYNDLPAYSIIPVGDYKNESVGRFKTSYLVDQIDEYYRGTNPGPIGVTTFVNLDDLYNTSTFGRVMGEMVMGELAMRGFDVLELRHSDALQFLGSDGEFALSRDVSAIKRERDLGGVVVGTYVASPQRVYVNARLLDPSSSMVLSAASVEMDKSSEIARLLRGGSFPATLERIPVRHLGIATYPMNVMAPGNSWMEHEEGGVSPELYRGKPDTFRRAK
jgi:TolB-like protein